MKKKGKQVISWLLCLALGGSLLAGCGKGEETLDGSRDITAGGQKEEDSSNDGSQKENNLDGKNPVGEDGNGQSDAPTPTEIVYSDATFDMLENYRERNIPSWYTEDSEGEISCNILLNAENEIVHYSYKKEEDGYHFWKYTLKESKEDSEVFYSWEREAVSWLESIKAEIDQGRVTVFTGEDQNDYAWYIAKGEISHLVKRERDMSGGFLDSLAEIQLEDWHITEMCKVAVLENGDVVTVDFGGTCHIHNQEDGSLIERFRCGDYLSLSVDGNQVYVIGRGNTSIMHYDAGQHEMKVEVKGAFGESSAIAVWEDNIYTCSSAKGLYCAKENSREVQKILDAGMYHFAKESGGIMELFVMGDIFYVAYYEKNTPIKKYFPAEPGDGPENSLTVYSLKSNDVILDMISEFQTEYPDIEIIYETGEGSDGSVTAADHIRALNARILAGDGPDVLVLDGLPIDSYQKKGILADLNPTFSDLADKLLPNLQELYSEGGKLYMLPLRISMPMFLVSDQVPEGAVSSLEALVEYSEENDGVAFRTSYADILEMLYCNFTPELVTDAETVDREALTEFLKLVRRYCESETATEAKPFMTYLQGRGDTYSFSIEDTELVLANIFNLGIYPAAAEIRNGKMIGNQGMCFPIGLLGINALSTKKSLADTFVKYAFSYEVQGRTVDLSGYPIHLEVLGEIAQEDESFAVLGTSTVSWRYYNQEESTWMVEQIKEVRRAFTRDESIWEIIRDAAEPYLKGAKGLNECVDEIVSRIQLYLYER